METVGCVLLSHVKKNPQPNTRQNSCISALSFVQEKPILDEVKSFLTKTDKQHINPPNIQWEAQNYSQ